MKYVIKNCDNYTEFDKDWTCRSTIQNRKGCYCCQDCTDCVMKQIVELAKGHTELCKNCDQQIKECDCSDICNAYRLDKILKLLDIQEIADER
jgi:hypothetical protein